MNRKRISSQLALGAVLVTALAGWPALGAVRSEGKSGLGSVDFAASCAPEVQPQLDRAVALLHHMTYRQALAGFESVTATDPSCAIAQWGIAMSQFQPLWPNRPGAEELGRGREALKRAMALEPPSERERLYIAAANEFFRSDQVDHWQRIERWERGQEALYRAYPDDWDAAALYALAHLATAPLAEQPRQHHERAAKILLDIHRQQPDHPGAVHYTIHANDTAGRERESLEIVRSYAEIAPNNPHALHMPTHIFVRLGSWQEVIDWNRRASAAALAHPAGERGELVSDEFPHTLEYLVYAALQLGDVEQAVAAWERLRQTETLQPSFKTAFHLASIPARIALESRDWDAAAAIEPRLPQWVNWDRFAWPEAISWFARGLGSARSGLTSEARRSLAAVERLRDQASDQGEEPFAREIEILRLELAAWTAHAGGEAEQGLQLLQQAVELEKATPKQPVTPAPQLPAQEQLADMLWELGRMEEALAAYELSLAERPGRRNSREGVERVAAMLAGTERR